MANIHAINVQGTEYGITAENGISQAQADAIATIGDVADLETTEKTTLVRAVNEVNGKFQKETVLYENQAPESNQPAQALSVSGLANAKALKIIYGVCLSEYDALKEEVFPIRQNVESEFYLSQSLYNKNSQRFSVYTRLVSINAGRTSINIRTGSIYNYDISSSTATDTESEVVEKVLKITALF